MAGVFSARHAVIPVICLTDLVCCVVCVPPVLFTPSVCPLSVCGLARLYDTAAPLAGQTCKKACPRSEKVCQPFVGITDF